MAFGKWSFLMKYIWPPSVIAGVLALLREWQRSGVKTKAILTVFFIPALFCVAGLVIRIAYFVLFNLPSFILSVLGWLLLISLFSGGGLYCYERLSGKRASHDSASYDYDIPSGGAADEKTEKDKNNWFHNKKNWFSDIKWIKK